MSSDDVDEITNYANQTNESSTSSTTPGGINLVQHYFFPVTDLKKLNCWAY